LNQMIFAGPPGRERNGYGAVVNVSDVQARHVDGIEPRVELSVPTPCRIESVVLTAQERPRLLRISAVKDAVMLQQRTYAKAHCLPLPLRGQHNIARRHLQAEVNILDAFFCDFRIMTLAGRQYQAVAAKAGAKLGYQHCLFMTKLSLNRTICAEERPTSMMTALVLICSLAKTPLAMDCGTDNAVDLLRVPGEYYSLVTCFSRAQAFIAASRYELSIDHYPKIVCGKPRLPANVG
jgi:hypothetical protein